MFAGTFLPLTFFFFLKYNKERLQCKTKIYQCQTVTRQIETFNTETKEIRNRGKRKEKKRWGKHETSLESTVKRRPGLVGDDCQRHSKVEIGAGESDLGTREAAWWER